MNRAPLRRPRHDRVIAGVGAGLAEHLGWEAVQVRIVLAALTLLGGAGALLYAWLWATVPENGETDGVVPLRRAFTRPDGQAPARSADPASAAPRDRVRGPQRRIPVAEIMLGLGLLAVGIALVLMRLDVDVRLDLILPTFAICVGVGLAWWQIADRARPDRSVVPRVLAALALVAVGVLMFFVTARQPNAWTVIAAALSVLLGVALAVAPWLLRLNRELIAERAGRAREAERSEIAAHLHDSVLQTLALIQQRSEAGSDIDRLARSQERQLRQWLFQTADGAPGRDRDAVDVEVAAHAAALEAEHAVRFEVVAVGVAPGVEAPEPLVAAAREAMLNAARHAGGTVTVYLEVAGDRITIDITDRGPGVDLQALPEGRMGIRESILGRMDRAGGSARIVPGPGGSGTSVRLAAPRSGAPSTPHHETETP
ncbi:ATP-binding protein [Leucobacter tardus]|uniref:PspC domain-containing protein n=1 Tax=Leucobacter tardus TaxID=501483 RepID=A0A939TMR4_9MICO|nr:ATP-binding protein [Leucobacter tardus]MBO2989444.1 PspC domain-containing protein [Leucobacter tardus]